jgi:drug/metabolite transporter (DMT)-like permease
LISAYGEYRVFKRRAGLLEMSSYLLIILGSFLSGSNDLSFDLWGFILMFLSLLAIAGNSIWVKYIKKEANLEDEEIIFYMSCFTFPIFLIMALYYN